MPAHWLTMNLQKPTLQTKSLLLPPTMPRIARISRIPMVTRKSHPRSKLATETKKSTATRNAKHKMLDADKKSPRLSYLKKKPSASTDNAEKAKAAYAKEHTTKVKLTLSALVTTSLNHILTCHTAFEHMHLHLILSDYMYATDVENLNKTSKPFAHFHKRLSHTEPNIIFKLS